MKFCHDYDDNFSNDHTEHAIKIVSWKQSGQRYVYTYNVHIKINLTMLQTVDF